MSIGDWRIEALQKTKTFKNKFQEEAKSDSGQEEREVVGYCDYSILVTKKKKKLAALPVSSSSDSDGSGNLDHEPYNVKGLVSIDESCLGTVSGRKPRNPDIPIAVPKIGFTKKMPITSFFAGIRDLRKDYRISGKKREPHFSNENLLASLRRRKKRC